MSDSPPDRQNWFRIFDSKFMVTVIGGLILAISTNMWQGYWKEQEYKQDLRNRQYEMVTSFANLYGVVLHTTLEAQYRRIWILDRNNLDKRYADFRTYEQTVQRYEFLMDKIQSTSSFDTLCAQIRVLFPASEVQQAANAADEAADKLTSAIKKSPQELYGMYREAEKLSQELITQMGNSIQQTK